MKKDTKHRVHGFMHRLSLQMHTHTHRRPNNVDSSVDLQVNESIDYDVASRRFGQSPCSVLVRGPTLHPYRTVPTGTPHQPLTLLLNNDLIPTLP